MKNDKDKALNNIRKAALLYNKNFLGKDILYVHGSVDEPEFLEATFYKKHFFHLTGVVLGEKSEISSAKDFFDSSISKTLSVNDFMLKDNGTTDLKLEILPKFLESTASSRMVGYFNKSGVKLETKILAGRDFVAMGFNKYKGDNPKFYVPNTILNNDIRKLIDKPRRVLAIYEKSRYDIRYTTCVYVAKGIDVHDICFPEKFYYLALDCITVDFPEKSIIKVENQLLNNKQVNSIYLPSGLIIDEKNVGRSIVSPDFIQKKDGKLTGIFEYKQGQEHTVKLSLEDGSFQKVDINLFKKAIEEKGLSHNKPEANKEKQNTKERHKENEEEL